MKYIIPILLALLYFENLSCGGQQNSFRTFNKNYRVGKIPDIDNFQKYNVQEILSDSFDNQYDKVIDSLYQTDTAKLKNDFFRRMDSMFASDPPRLEKDNPKELDSFIHEVSSYSMKNLFRKHDFRNNRSRIVSMDEYTNNQTFPHDTTDNSISIECDCYISWDTLFVSMYAGFFSASGIQIKVFNKSYESSFYTFVSGIEVYKSNPDDTAFANFALVKSKYQSLILNHKPSFKAGQQLSGYLTFTSDDYYGDAYDGKLDTLYVEGKLYFTCKTRLKTLEDFR